MTPAAAAAAAVHLDAAATWALSRHVIDWHSLEEDAAAAVRRPLRQNARAPATSAQPTSKLEIETLRSFQIHISVCPSAACVERKSAASRAAAHSSATAPTIPKAWNIISQDPKELYREKKEKVKKKCKVGFPFDNFLDANLRLWFSRRLKRNKQDRAEIWTPLFISAFFERREQVKHQRRFHHTRNFEALEGAQSERSARARKRAGAAGAAAAARAGHLSRKVFCGQRVASPSPRAK